MTRYRILPYRQGSKSARALADALGGKVLKLVDSKFVPKLDDVIINWGNVSIFNTVYINGDTGRLKSASNKLLFFQNMAANAPDVIPKFWTNKEEIPDEEFPVVCRTLLAGHSGAGIVIANVRDDLVDANLFVKYEKKRDEYRVHIGQQPNVNCPVPTVIAVQRKAKRNGAENVNWQIRSHDNGFVFVRNNISPPPRVIEAAIKSFEASALDFGAVDVVFNDQKQQAFVLEINTAPGLEGQTITDYANFFKGYANA